MNKLLFDEQPLVIQPSLAKIIGLNESIIIQQLHYWLQKSRNVKEGHTWVYNTYQDWHDQFPFWGLNTIRRAISRLEEKGLIVTSNYNKLKIDNTKWYRIDYQKLDDISMGKPLAQNGQTDSPTWTDGQPNMDRPLPEITTENTSDIKKDIHHKRDELVYDDESPYLKMAHYLLTKIKEWKPDFKMQGNLQKWSDCFRLIHERDKRSKEDIKAVIEWATGDNFWQSNILSPSSLRKHFDRLQAQMIQRRNYRGGDHLNAGVEERNRQSRADELDSLSL